MKTIDFEALFRASPYPNLVMDNTLTVLDANDAYLRATGTTREAIVGKYVFDAFPENSGDPDSTNVAVVKRSLEKAIATGLPDTTAFLRYAIPKSRGENLEFAERYWSTTSTPILGADGKTAFVVQHPIDVTDLYSFNKSSQLASVQSKVKVEQDVDNISRAQQHEAMLRILNDQQGRLQNLFNQAPGFFAVLTGPTHIFEMANEAYYQLVGHRDIIGKPVWDALPEIKGQGFEELLNDVYVTGKSWVGRSIQVAIQRNPGEPMTSRHIDVLYQPIFAADGTVSGIFVQGHDVTEAYESQTAYLETEERLREGMMAAKMVVWDWSLDDQIVFSDNTAVILGAVPETIKEFIGLLHEEDRDKGRQAIDLAVARGSELKETLRLVKLDSGDVIWIDIRGKIRKDVQGLPYTMRGVILDVTERMQATENLRTVDRQKDEFLAMLAHELRNPLAPISSAAQILTLTQPDQAQLQRTAEIIKRQIKHLVGLVDDLLDVSRVTRGLITTDMEVIDVKHVISEAIEQSNPIIQSRHHRLSIEVPPDDVRILGDHKRMVQVLTNLLINAAKYTPNGGSITVRLAVNDELVLLNVVDDGSGIAPELLPRVFDLFTQGNRTADRSQGGLGIGLALVKSLVETHGGTVKAFSSPGRKGSWFEIRLPRLYDVTPQENKTTTPAINALRVLVVDDNEDAANTLADVLRSLGHVICVEYTPRAAIERAVGEPQDVFLLDIGLPGMDGIALVRYLRAQPETANALIIAITGYGADENRKEALVAGFDEYLVKPVDIAALVDLITNHPRH